MEATVDFGYNVSFWMQYIIGYTTELSASFLFWSGKVHMFWEGQKLLRLNFYISSWCMCGPRAAPDGNSPVLTEISSKSVT